MATKYWLGTADAVAQVWTGEITAYDAATTYTVTVGGVAISTVGTGGTAAATAAALVALLNASTHPYFAAVTWSVPSGAEVRGTADTAGVPFVAALTKSGGTGTVTDFAETTASAGANDWSTATNWSDGAVPATGDAVIVENSSVSIRWGLDQNAVALVSLEVRKTFTGEIGLDRARFATVADGATYSATTKPEYRQSYLKIGSDVIDIGTNFAGGNPSGSSRIKIHQNEGGASVNTVHGTAQAGPAQGIPACLLLITNASGVLNVRGGSVGLAADEPDETCNLSALNCAGGTVEIGAGVTATTINVSGGAVLLRAAATVTTVNVDGGVLTTEGDYTITALNVADGTCNANHRKSSGSAITTATVTGGTLNFAASPASRTVDTLAHNGGAVVRARNLTVTTWTHPTDAATVQVS